MQADVQLICEKNSAAIAILQFAGASTTRVENPMTKITTFYDVHKVTQILATTYEIN